MDGSFVDGIFGLSKQRKHLKPMIWSIIPGIDEFDSFIGTFNIYDGQNGSKDLILHDGIVRFDVDQYRRFNVAFIGVSVAANCHIGAL